jgi:hypothetical protein
MKKSLIILHIGIVIAALIGYFILGLAYYNKPVPATDTTNLAQQCFELSKTTSRQLLTFESKELGFSFSYPAWFGEVAFEIRKASETGEVFKGTFANVPFEFGGITNNYSEGKEGWFTEFPGYTLKNDKYYYNHLSWQDPNMDIVIEKLLKKIDIQGNKLLLLKGSGELTLGDGLPDGVFGALVNLKNKKFHGLAFTANITSRHQNEDKIISLEEFESVLKTLEIK